MKTKYILITLSFLMSFSIKSKAQETILFNKTEKSTVRLAYRQNKSYYKNPIDDVFEELARRLKVPQYTIEIFMSYNTNIKISKNATNLKTSLSFNNFRFSGDNKYRGFDISDVFIPPKISFIGIVSNSKQMVVGSIKMVGAKLIKGEKFTANFSDATPEARYVFNFENLDFIFDYQNKQKLKEKLDNIDNYFKFNKKINDAQLYMSNIDYENVDKIELYDKKLKEIKNMLTKIYSTNIINKLQLTQHDPHGFIKNYNDAKNQLNSASLRMEKQINIIHILYYKKGMQALAKYDKTAAENYFNKSATKKPDYTPTIKELAKLSFIDKKYQQTEELIYKIFSLIMDEQTKKEAIQLSKNLYQVYINQADKFLDNLQYNSAIKKYIAARKLCSETKIECSSLADKNLDLAKNGLYKQYLKDATKDISTDKYDEAIQKIETAIIYQQTNTKAIPNQQEAQELMREVRNLVYNNFLKKARLALKKREIDISISLIERAINYQKVYKKYIPTNLEAKKMILEAKQEKYRLLINYAYSLTQKGNYHKALEKYEQAQEIEFQYNIIKQSTLPKKIKETAKKVILKDIKDGKDKVSLNQLKQARQTIQMVNDKTKKYSLQKDPEINEEVKSLRSSIFKQKCINTDNEYNSFLEKAAQFEIKTEYIKADKQYQNAIDVLKANIDCGIDNSSAKNKKKEIEHAVNYQKTMLEINNNVEYSFYHKVIPEYQKLTNFYSQNNIQKYGIKHKSLFDFSKKQKNGFLVFILKHFIKENELQNAFDILSILVTQRRYKGSALKNEQRALADKISKLDFSADPLIIPKFKASEYTNDNKQLKYFKKQYIKNWKKFGK